MHTPSRFLVVVLSGLALLGCAGEAEWTMQGGAPAAPAKAPTSDGSHLSSFQGLSSGLPANPRPTAIAHLDGTVYLVVEGQLFRLVAGGKAWTPVALPLAATEKVTSVVRIDLSLYVSTSEGLLRYDWTSEKTVRLTGAPRGGSAMVKKGAELLLASTDGLFASRDQGVTFVKRSAAALFSQPIRALAASPGALRMFAAAEVGGLFYSDDLGATWSSGLVVGEVKALSAAGEFVLVETASGTFRSDNYGNTFNAATVGGQALSFGFSGTKAFAGTMTGVRISDDGGKVWRDSNEGLPASSQVSALFVAGPAVIAATATQVFVAELF